MLGDLSHLLGSRASAFLAATGTLVLTVSLVSNAEAQQRGGVGARFVSLYFENDVFLDTDQLYTNGVRVSWAGQLRADESRWYLPAGLLSGPFSRDCDRDPARCYEWWTGWVIGQSMYTPQDITDPDVIRDDRPYGGWLHAGPTFSAVRPAQYDQRATEHQVQLMLGVTGSPSFAREAQTFVHEYIARGAAEPMGWRHQIAAEPTVNLLYSGRQRWLELHRGDGAQRVVDFVPEWTAAVGNVFTYAGLGATTRLGFNLGEDFGAARVEPVIAMAGREHAWELYGFGRAGVRAIAHNAFLDGGLFRRSVHTIDKKAVVSDVELGLTARYGSRALSFRWVRRSPEIDARRVHQEYGSLSLTLLR